MTLETIRLPEYTKLIAAADHECVMAAPKYAEQVVAVFVDATAWPPQLNEHLMLVTAAARLASGEWVVSAKRKGAWEILVFEDIRAPRPHSAEPAPFTIERDGDADDESGDDDGPFSQLVAIGDVVVGVPEDLGAEHRPHVYVRRGGAWRPEPTLPVSERGNRGRAVQLVDGEALQWNGQLYHPTGTGFEPLDARGCHDFTRTGAGVFALHEDQLVRVQADEVEPVLAGHTVVTFLRGPRGTLILQLSVEDARGSHAEFVLFEPAEMRVARLPEELGELPAFATFTAAGDLLLHDDRAQASLTCCSAAFLAALPRIAATELPVPPPVVIPTYDERGAASRPIVATTGDRIAIAVDRRLRFHAIDSPQGVVELEHPIVAIAAARQQFAVLDTRGVLHLYDARGEYLASRPAVTTPRSLAVAGDSWVVLGGDRVVLVDDRGARTIELSGAVAAAADPSDNLVIACDPLRLVHWTAGELRELPPTREQIVALAAVGDGQFACAGPRDLYLLDLDHPELASLSRRARRPHLAGNPATGHVAYCDAASTVEIETFDGTGLGTALPGGIYYSTYMAPTDGPVTVHGLAFLDDGRLVIALDEGRANIIDPDSHQTLKLDEQPGDAFGRWLFLCAGRILIAG